MSHYRPYPAYKDSGVEWLGEVPEHWRMVRFRFVFSESKKRNGKKPVGNMLSVSGYRGVEEKKYDFDERKRTSEELENYRVVRPGQLAANTMWLNYGGLGVSAITGHVSPAYAVYDIDPAIYPAFAHHLLRSDAYIGGYNTYLYGIRPNSFQIKDNDFQSIPVLLPPRGEQNNISKFLDRETARIDALIEKKQRLVELLKEKRQAVITQAVTKGLDPDVPMKDSGVEWLGEVPEHWMVMALRYALSGIDQGKSPECESRPAELHEWGVLRTGCVNGGVFRLDENKALPSYISAHKEHEVQVGDLLMSRASGSLDLIGSAAYVRAVRPHLLLSDKVFRLNVNAHASSEYLSFVLGSIPSREQIQKAINGAEGLANNITKPSVKDIQIVIPPIQEQNDILRQLQSELDTLRKLIERTDSSVGLLREHRSALITAAVTGQIDLREAA